MGSVQEVWRVGQRVLVSSAQQTPCKCNLCACGGVVAPMDQVNRKGCSPAAALLPRRQTVRHGGVVWQNARLFRHPVLAPVLCPGMKRRMVGGMYGAAYGYGMAPSTICRARDRWRGRRPVLRQEGNVQRVGGAAPWEKVSRPWVWPYNGMQAGGVCSVVNCHHCGGCVVWVCAAVYMPPRNVPRTPANVQLQQVQNGRGAGQPVTAVDTGATCWSGRGVCLQAG